MSCEDCKGVPQSVCMNEDSADFLAQKIADAVGGATLNIYNSNGTLLADRTVTGGGNSLRFDDLSSFRREVILSGSGFNIISEDDENIFGIGFDGGIKYCDLSASDRVVNGIFKFPGIFTDMFAGTLILDPNIFSDNSFAGALLEGGSRIARLSATLGNNGHALTVEVGRVLFDSGSGDPDVRVVIGEPSGTQTLPAYQDKVAADADAGLSKFSLWQTDGTGAPPFAIAGQVHIKQ